MRSKRAAVWIGSVAAMTLLLIAPVHAGEGFGLHGWGLRGGLSVDPDQFFIGGHLAQSHRRVRRSHD
jgi:hypothetical protein